MINLPARKMLFFGIVLALLLVFTLVNFHETPSVSGISEKALYSLCKSAGMEEMIASSTRLSNHEFGSDVYSSTGNPDTKFGDKGGSAHSSKEDQDVRLVYENPTSMINTGKLLRGNATSSFRGKPYSASV